ncbi:hypothetical protein BCY91_07605 [Pelobium manganitolerans]|uniref:Cardiolipin synthase N-terminal domain-containing protein n=1 Tax=Pelobium manganitolerans TaxID=1842495 RepID=A0A419S3W8_9SPHI|nr:hypothetical protein [Pelobium manganitolerans]RKD14343.1 hypothetical protein BCY91_07605 [Pelobium manganitolerans]
MELIVGMSILTILAIVTFCWLLPIIIIALSNRTSGAEKAAWILAVIFISWFAWIFYALLAPLNKR